MSLICLCKEGCDNYSQDRRCLLVSNSMSMASTLKHLTLLTPLAPRPGTMPWGTQARHYPQGTYTRHCALGHPHHTTTGALKPDYVLEHPHQTMPWDTQTRHYALGHSKQTPCPGTLKPDTMPWDTQTRHHALGHSNQTLCPRSPTSHPEALIHPEAPTPDCPVVPTPDYAYSTHTTALGHHTTLCPEAPTPDTMPCGTHITSHSVAHQTLPWSPTPD